MINLINYLIYRGGIPDYFNKLYPIFLCYENIICLFCTIVNMFISYFLFLVTLFNLFN
ncbi:hypothetical protein CLOSYM_01897 [[Clostridium] symbiosum ATCC 14940]|uniref:Uncharacterized protein n=1 Tax=[Clostridium] symbiosum ATCC 14940 TaxID=411472 RepID=A0ABC9TZ61_CLOSY|nr:hypothetical protein CLOSYM_01897 [[Clostridium] symbiosum ATCC 14940]